MARFSLVRFGNGGISILEHRTPNIARSALALRSSSLNGVSGNFCWLFANRLPLSIGVPFITIGYEPLEEKWWRRFSFRIF